MALRALATIVGALPWRWLRALGAALGWMAGSVLRIRRAHVEAAMARAGVSGARAMYRALGASALEFLWMAARRRDLEAIVQVDEASREAWERARGQGRGVVVAASHTGNWDLAACAMAAEGELLVVTKHLSMPVFDRFWQTSRARYGVRLADARGALDRARATLGRGGAVAMMIDQVPDDARHGIACDFLGAPALVDRAPAALAASARAPLVVAAARRAEGGTHVLSVLAVLEPPAHGRRAWIDRATREATRALDEFVRSHPAEWLWLHRRWKGARLQATRAGDRPSTAPCWSPPAGSDTSCCR